MTYKICYIRWRDAEHRVGWISGQTLTEYENEPTLVNESVGYLVTENASHIVLAQSVNTYRVGDVLKIPCEMIVERLTLAAPESATP